MEITCCLAPLFQTPKLGLDLLVVRNKLTSVLLLAYVFILLLAEFVCCFKFSDFLSVISALLQN